MVRNVSLVLVSAPFAIELARLLAFSKPVYLWGDLALTDIRVRDAMRFTQMVGPYDRFGWSHPGPALFYLLSGVAHVIGGGGKADFVGATLINGLAAIGAVLVVRRRSGPWASMWTASCLGLLAIGLASRASPDLGAPVASPWDPYVVIFPLVFFLVLATDAACGSWFSLVGAMLVGTFIVQTNIATLPLVGAFLALALAARVVRAMRRRPSAVAHAPWSARSVWFMGAGLLLLALAWIPTLLEQVEDHPGNLTLIWRFFSAHHQPQGTGVALRAVLGTEGELLTRTTAPFPWIVLGAIVIAGGFAMVIGVRRRDQFAVTMGAVSIVGLGIGVFAVTRIVGPIFAYLLEWTVVIPIVALIALGIALIQARQKSERARPSIVSTVCRGALVGVAMLAAVVSSTLVARLPGLVGASMPGVGEAAAIVTHQLGQDKQPFSVGVLGLSIAENETLSGLFDQLDAEGYHPRVDRALRTQYGSRYVAWHPTPVAVNLWWPSLGARELPGYVGHTRYADIVITRHRTEGAVQISNASGGTPSSLPLYPDGDIHGGESISFDDGREAGVVEGGYWMPSNVCNSRELDALPAPGSHNGSGPGFTVVIWAQAWADQLGALRRPLCFSPVTVGSTYVVEGMKFAVSLLPEPVRGH